MTRRPRTALAACAGVYLPALLYVGAALAAVVVGVGERDPATFWTGVGMLVGPGLVVGAVAGRRRTNRGGSAR